MGANKKIPGSDIGRPQGSTMAQLGVSLALETKVAGLYLRVDGLNDTNPASGYVNFMYVSM